MRRTTLGGGGGGSLRGFENWESGGELERVVYVSVWRLGIELRMARPFRVPGVASSWEPSSSGKVSQDLSSFFRSCRPSIVPSIFCMFCSALPVRATIVDAHLAFKKYQYIMIKF